MRFDGKIGFFGGFVEEGDTVEETLAKEVCMYVCMYVY
jgi:hypothetical protein